MKRLIACILCVVLLCTSGTVAFAAETEGTDIPTIYVYGINSGLVAENPDGSRYQVYSLNLPEDFIETKARENFDVFKRAFFTQKWDEFCEVLRDIIVPLFDELRLDENGNAPNGSHVSWHWSRETINGSKVGGKYLIGQFPFEYDWRMDPYKTAEILHSYIEDVLAVTGESHVNLIGRCLGACITAAYMEKYDGEYVSDYLLYCGALYGATQCSKAFCGEFWLESGGIDRFLYDIRVSADDVYDELIHAFVTLLHKTGGLDIAAWAVNNVYRKIYMQIIPPILSETYGTFPGYWSMVSDRDYEKAKATVFADSDMEKWQSFIDIIDAYHYNVQVRTPELFAHYREKGIEIANVVKYAYQTIPVTRHSDMQSDTLCSLEDASLGATCSAINGKLSNRYCKKADPLYIAPDRQVDASTCLLPERTWFIKNLQHKNFPTDVNRLFEEILNNEDFTVRTSERYPQFLVWNDEAQTLDVMTEENCDTTARYRVSFFRAFTRFWHALIEVLRMRAQQRRGTTA